MPGGLMRDRAEAFAAAAARHPQVRGARVAAVGDGHADVELDVAVEMPLHMKADGVSENGIRAVETVTARLASSYPWSSPTFLLRLDFPRGFPHLEPGSAEIPPRPCLVDADQREHFFQFESIELGVFHLVHQLALWLQHAAEGALIDPEQGWEPTLRRNLSQIAVIDAPRVLEQVTRSGGHRVVRARFGREGPGTATLGSGVYCFFDVGDEAVPLKRGDAALFEIGGSEGSSIGQTVCCFIWPDKLATGAPFVAETYLPETVATLGALRDRAQALNCGRALEVFFGGLERCFEGLGGNAPMPILVVLCARRPFHLIGSASDIEFLAYVVEIRPRPKRTSLFAGGADEPVSPAMQIDQPSPALLRSVSDAPEIGPVAMLGCGSVGSKMAMHLARCGVTLPVLCDDKRLLPHNLARHALSGGFVERMKAVALAAEILPLGQKPRVQLDDLVRSLSTIEGRRSALPRQAEFALNATASLAVREALSALPPPEVKPRLAEAALFGLGQGGMLLIEGPGHNPTLSDLAGELYAHCGSEQVRRLLFDPKFGLAEVQIGQGCSSRTMPMTDMRLSAMTAELTEAFVDAAKSPPTGGLIVVGAGRNGARGADWTSRPVPPFEVVSIEGAEGWTLRLSSPVLEEIRAEAARHPEVETGGVLLGACNARLRAVTVHALLPAPEDSIRSRDRFVLGARGLRKAIADRHRSSGQTLIDVGTWHSHLVEQGPSLLDRRTARDLAEERPPPSVLLIATPARLWALMHARPAS